MKSTQNRKKLEKIVRHLMDADPKLERDVALVRANVLWKAPKVYSPGLGMVENPHYLGGQK